MRRAEPEYRRILGLGIVLLVAAILLLLYMADAARASQFEPPTARQAQRIIGNAYDARLRPFYPRAGIITRCKGRRHLLCSVHVWRRGEHLYWTITRVDLENGAARTALSPNLEGVIHIAHRTLLYRSQPWRAS